MEIVRWNEIFEFFKKKEKKEEETLRELKIYTYILLDWEILERDNGIRIFIILIGTFHCQFLVYLEIYMIRSEDFSFKTVYFTPGRLQQIRKKKTFREKLNSRYERSTRIF